MRFSFLLLLSLMFSQQALSADATDGIATTAPPMDSVDMPAFDLLNQAQGYSSPYEDRPYKTEAEKVNYCKVRQAQIESNKTALEKFKAKLKEQQKANVEADIAKLAECQKDTEALFDSGADMDLILKAAAGTCDTPTCTNTCEISQRLERIISIYGTLLRELESTFHSEGCREVLSIDERSNTPSHGDGHDDDSL